MNKLKYLLSAFVLLCFASCKDDPWEDVADGNTTGTCMNWAGEDAKNWDCVFAGASNPDTGKPVDLTQFYRQIPKGEST